MRKAELIEELNEMITAWIYTHRWAPRQCPYGTIVALHRATGSDEPTSPGDACCTIIGDKPF
jgi:hypothetical protein